MRREVTGVALRQRAGGREELGRLAADELGAKERDLTDQLFRMRIQKSMGQLEAPDKLRTVRRDLARIKTVLRQNAKRVG